MSVVPYVAFPSYLTTTAVAMEKMPVRGSITNLTLSQYLISTLKVLQIDALIDRTIQPTEVSHCLQNTVLYLMLPRTGPPT